MRHRKEGNIRENGKIGGGNEEERGRGKKRKEKGAICLSEKVNRMEERSKRELGKGWKGWRRECKRWREVWKGRKERGGKRI